MLDKVDTFIWSLTVPLNTSLSKRLMPNSHQTRRVLLHQVEKNWKMKSRHGKLEHWFFTQVSNEIQHVL